MSAFFKLTWIESKLFLRNSVGAFFILVFPILMLVIFGAMYGNTPERTNCHASLIVSSPVRS